MPITDQVQKATSRIGRVYFALPVCGMPTPIKRERVYCYELYHQLRCLPLDTTVTAEPDKRGHPSFAAGRAQIQTWFFTYRVATRTTLP